MRRSICTWRSRTPGGILLEQHTRKHGGIGLRTWSADDGGNLKYFPIILLLHAAAGIGLAGIAFWLHDLALRLDLTTVAKRCNLYPGSNYRTVIYSLAYRGRYFLDLLNYLIQSFSIFTIKFWGKPV